MSISLVAGLGNPGREYEATRHNAGFLVVDALARELGLAWQAQRAFKAETARWDPSPGTVVHFVKPLTYMNDSGRAVQAMTGFYKIPASALVAVYDDLNLDLARVKISVGGGPGGHNGVADLIRCFGPGFVRYRVGIGPKQPAEMDLKDFVLGKFTQEQSQLFTNNLDRLASGLRLLLEQGTDRAMNLLNRKHLP